LLNYSMRKYLIGIVLQENPNDFHQTNSISINANLVLRTWC
jgi:hypothetical protein